MLSVPPVPSNVPPEARLYQLINALPDGVAETELLTASAHTTFPVVDTTEGVALTYTVKTEELTQPKLLVPVIV